MSLRHFKVLAHLPTGAMVHKVIVKNTSQVGRTPTQTPVSSISSSTDKSNSIQYRWVYIEHPGPILDSRLKIRRQFLIPLPSSPLRRTPRMEHHEYHEEWNSKEAATITPTTTRRRRKKEKKKRKWWRNMKTKTKKLCRMKSGKCLILLRKCIESARCYLHGSLGGGVSTWLDWCWHGTLEHSHYDARLLIILGHGTVLARTR